MTRQSTVSAVEIESKRAVNHRQVHNKRPSWSLANQSVPSPRWSAPEFLITGFLPSGGPSVFKVVPGSLSNPLLGNIIEEKKKKNHAALTIAQNAWMSHPDIAFGCSLGWAPSVAMCRSGQSSPQHIEKDPNHTVKSQFAWWHERNTCLLFSFKIYEKALCCLKFQKCCLTWWSQTFMFVLAGCVIVWKW